MSVIDKLFANSSKREIELASFILSQINPKILITDNRNVLENEFRKLNITNEEVLSNFNIKIKENLITDKDCDWLKSDLRAQLFCWSYFSNNALLSNMNIQYEVDFFENFQKQIDFCNFSLNETFQGFNNFSNNKGLYAMPEKTALLASLAVSPQILNQSFTQPQNIPDWSNQSRNHDNNQALDNIFQRLNFRVSEKHNAILSSFQLFKKCKTEVKNTNWINQNDEVQMYWIIEYLKKSGCFLNPINFLPKNNNEQYIQILASIDTVGENESPNKKLFISNMRKAWSQKKFRDKKTAESAQDILLSKKSKKQLTELCKTTGFTSVAMLEYLIQQEYEQI